MAEIKDGEDRDAAGVAFDQPLDPDQLPRHLSERETFIAADIYEASGLATNTAALNAPPRRVCLSRAQKAVMCTLHVEKATSSNKDQSNAATSFDVRLRWGIGKQQPRGAVRDIHSQQPPLRDIHLQRSGSA